MVIGGDVQLGSLLDRDIFISGSISGSDLRSFLQHPPSSVQLSFGEGNGSATYGVESNGKWAAILGLLCFFGMIDDRLVILREKTGSRISDVLFLIVGRRRSDQQWANIPRTNHAKSSCEQH